MKSIRVFSIVLALGTLLLAVSSLRAANDFKPMPAPAWQLKDVDGKVVSSEQFKGKIVVVDFWATWCPHCIDEVAGYVQLQDKYRDAGLAFVGVEVGGEAPEVVKKFMADNKINYQVVIGDDQIVAAFGGVTGIPTTFIIDRGQTVAFRKIGGWPTAKFEAALQPFLK
jgi:thiol-disulfide isomerase/thioredoxin